jgi:hypothetical protein
VRKDTLESRHDHVESIMVGGAFDQREEPRFFGSEPPSGPLTSRADIVLLPIVPARAVDV